MKYSFANVLFLIVAISFTCSNCFAQTASREDVLREIQAKRADLQELERQFLAPTAEDQGASWYDKIATAALSLPGS